MMTRLGLEHINWENLAVINYLSIILGKKSSTGQLFLMSDLKKQTDCLHKILNKLMPVKGGNWL